MKRPSAFNFDSITRCLDARSEFSKSNFRVIARRHWLSRLLSVRRREFPQEESQTSPERSLSASLSTRGKGASLNGQGKVIVVARRNRGTELSQAVRRCVSSGGAKGIHRRQTWTRTEIRPSGQTSNVRLFRNFLHSARLAAFSRPLKPRPSIVTVDPVRLIATPRSRRQSSVTAQSDAFGEVMDGRSTFSDGAYHRQTVADRFIPRHRCHTAILSGWRDPQAIPLIM